MFQDIQSILPENLKKAGVAGKIDEKRILALYRQEVKKYLDHGLQERVRPLAWENQVIIVASLADEATRIIKDNEAIIVKTMNYLAGRAAVKKVRYVT